MESDHSVLIVENEPNLGKSLSTMLQKVGYSATIAANTQEAYIYFRKKCYHTIIFNQRCIDGDIVHFLESIQSQIKDKIQVIFLVHEADTIPSIREKEKMFVRYIQLPTFPEDLLRFITLTYGNHGQLI